jgi:hypothetical protein
MSRTDQGSDARWLFGEAGGFVDSSWWVDGPA